MSGGDRHRIRSQSIVAGGCSHCWSSRCWPVAPSVPVLSLPSTAPTERKRDDGDDRPSGALDEALAAGSRGRIPRRRLTRPASETRLRSVHELPITQGILEIVLEHATRAGAARVTDIHVVLGELSSYVDDSIEFYWEIISRGTAAERARLHFERVPLRFECGDCGERFLPQGATFACPACGGERVRVEGGDELRVEAIDVEDVHAEQMKASDP